MTSECKTPTKRNLGKGEPLAKENKISMKTNFCWKLAPVLAARMLSPGRGRRGSSIKLRLVKDCPNISLLLGDCFPLAGKTGLGAGVVIIEVF